MSAIKQRSRRATAGKRMTILTGEALEQDEAFWGHDTWAEDDSGNESFHSSDEDSEHKRDLFDSDFDDSESDHEEEEREAGEEEEKELARQERRRRAASNRSYVDIASAGRDLMVPKKGVKGGNKRIIGDGLNAGLVLNIPPNFSHSVSNYCTAQAPVGIGQSSAVQPSAVSTSTSKKIEKQKKKPRITAAATRPTRKATRLARDVRKSEIQQTALKQAAPDIKTTVESKKKRKQFTQEEILLEAVNETEAENERWLLGRKRMQAQSEKDKETPGREFRGKVVEKFVSRRGYLNTINFPDMDHLPPILSRNNEAHIAPPKILCAVTGKPARYRDPKTKMGYYDLPAFKEIRRRYDAKEPLVQRTDPSVGVDAVYQYDLMPVKKKPKRHNGTFKTKPSQTLKQAAPTSDDHAASVLDSKSNEVGEAVDSGNSEANEKKTTKRKSKKDNDVLKKAMGMDASSNGKTATKLELYPKAAADPLVPASSTSFDISKLQTSGSYDDFKADSSTIKNDEIPDTTKSELLNTPESSVNPMPTSNCKGDKSQNAFSDANSPKYIVAEKDINCDVSHLETFAATIPPDASLSTTDSVVKKEAKDVVVASDHAVSVQPPSSVLSSSQSSVDVSISAGQAPNDSPNINASAPEPEQSHLADPCQVIRQDDTRKIPYSPTKSRNGASEAPLSTASSRDSLSANKDSTDSPNSPSRRSPRQRKPSVKVLENLELQGSLPFLPSPANSELPATLQSQHDSETAPRNGST